VPGRAAGIRLHEATALQDGALRRWRCSRWATSSGGRAGAASSLGRATGAGEQPARDLNSEGVDFRATSEYFKPIRIPIRAPAVAAADPGRLAPGLFFQGAV
jgi:hypothetical protein